MIEPFPNSAMIFLKNPSFFVETLIEGAPEIANKPYSLYPEYIF